MRTHRLTTISLLLISTLSSHLTSCTKLDEVVTPTGVESSALDKNIKILTPIRDYNEAFALAQKSIELVDAKKTRSDKKRIISNQRGQCVTISSTRSEGSVDTLMYIFNFENNEGFSIIAANRAVDPILAVAEKGSYTYGIPTKADNFNFYMDAMVDELSSIIPPAIDTIHTYPTFRTVEVDEYRSCEPLVPVHWGQEGPFGEYAANGFSGCVATAVAQIMAYYRFPETFTTTYPSSIEHAHETITLNWDALIINPDCYQISALLREIGQRVDADYSAPGSTPANSQKVPSAMRSFGYSCNSGLTNFLLNTVYATLDDNRPIYMRGTDQATQKGHAWVVDGYQYSRVGTEYYEYKLIDTEAGTIFYDYVLTHSTVVTTNAIHCNWGWDGFFDGYYTAINSCSVGTHVFKGLQTIVSINVY